MTEVWLPVPGYEGHYQVSSEGRIYSIFARRGDGFMRGTIDNYGYNRVFLTKNGERKRFMRHRVVCEAFNGPQPEGREVGHLNGRRLDNRAVNLAWVTRAENVGHSKAHGTFVPPPRPPKAAMVRGIKNHVAKLTEGIVAEARRRFANGESGRSLARQFGVTSANMSAAIRGQTWAHVGEADAPNSEGSCSHAQ